MSNTNIAMKPIVHFEHLIDFYPNPKGNIDEISSSSFRIKGKNLKYSPKLTVIHQNAQWVMKMDYTLE